MATTSLPAPSLVLRQQFSRQVAVSNQSLTPFLMGPAATLIRYAESSERALGLLGVYNPIGTVIAGTSQTLYAWPNKPTGAVLDVPYTQVHIRNAMLRYHNDTAGSALRVTRNSLRSPTVIYRTNTYGTSTIGSQGVTEGDRVLITGLDSASAAFSLSTYVIRVQGDVVAATVGSPAPATSNIAASTAAAAIVASGTNSGTITATTSGSAYSGLSSRRPSETYTITVTVGGVAGVARLRVVSSSGTDSVADIGVSSLASAIGIGTRGLTATFAAGTSSSFSVGDTWTITVTQLYAVPTFTVSGTYTGTVDRTYIVEVLDGGLISTNALRVRITSQDGTDSLQPTTLTLASGSTSTPFAVGTAGLTATLAAANGLMIGDKWTVSAVAAKEGIMRTLVLAHDFPANVLTDSSAALNISLYIVDNVTLSAKSATPGEYQYVAEDTQISIRAGATASTSKWVNAGVQTRLPVLAPAGFGAISEIFVTYRAWMARGASILTITANDDLDSLLPGPTHPDNPLKYAVSLARGSAGGERVLAFSVGNPGMLVNWQAGLTISGSIRSAYGHVPLTDDVNVLDVVFSHVSALNGETSNYYRVLWSGSKYTTGGLVLSAAFTTNTQQALATIEDDPSSTGTQYTLVRLTSSNANFLTAGIRAGDEVRYNFAIDSFGDVTYEKRTVGSVLSATQLLVATAFGGEEAVAKRFEIYRQYSSADLEIIYAAGATARASDLVRYVLAPQVQIGSYTLPAYFAAAVLAGLRASKPAQQSLSRLAVPGIVNVLGLSGFDIGQLDRLAAAGAMILIDDVETGTVIVRHGVTTGETEILAKREESMVSARHANLFVIVDRLKPYVAQINLSTNNLDDLADLVRAELDSVKRSLQSRNATPELGGQLVDLVVTFVGEMAGSEDTLKIIMQMALGRPGNYIDASVLIA